MRPPPLVLLWVNCRNTLSLSLSLSLPPSLSQELERERGGRERWDG